MKIKYLFLIALLVCVGCNKKEERKEIEYKHITSYYKKIDDETVKLMFILENVSNNDGVIKYIGYGASDDEGKSLGFTGKEVNIEFKKNQQILITETLKASSDKIKSIYLIPFYEPKLNIKQAESTGDNNKEQEIAKFTKKITSRITDKTTLFNVELQPDENISTSKIELIVYDEENYPLCIAYSDVANQIKANKNNEYEFECENVIEKSSNIEIFYK